MADLASMIQQAHQFINSGRMDQAEQTFRNILQFNPNSPELISDWGIALHGLGRLQEAEQAFRRALQLNPNLSNVYSNLGVCLQGRGAHAEALAMHRRSIELDPKFAAGYLNLGNTLSDMGRYEEALQCHRRAVELNPQVANGYTNLGNTLMELGRREEALQSHQMAVQLEPNSATAHLNLGNTLHSLGRYQEAEAMHRRSVELNPRMAAGYSNWGNTLYELNRLDDALKACQKAVEIDPNFRNGHMNLGNVLRRINRLDEAKFHHQRAVEIDPKYADGYLNLGNTLYSCSQFDDALATFRKCLELRPHFPSALSNMGMTYTQMGRFPEAFEFYEKALSQDPNFVEAVWNRGWTRLLLSRWEEAWKDYEWRFKLKVWDKKFSPKPFWEGQPLQGKTILLGAEQGIGDTLMMLRYMKWLKDQGATTILQVPRKLHTLLSNVPHIDKLWVEGDPWPEHDYFAPLMSLMPRSNATPETLPREVPYIFPNKDLVELWKKRLEPIQGFRIGIAWQGSPTFTSDRWRSVPLKDFAPIAKIPGVRLISLQRMVGLDQLQQIRGQFEVIELNGDIDKQHGSFMDTAAIMHNLDLLICSDTSLPHLAGAMGLPVWLILGVIPDWRWLLDREDCPLYPTMRLFRQKERHYWGDVFEKVAEELKKHLEQKDPFERVWKELEENPTSVDLRLRMGISLHQAGRFNDAVKVQQQAVAIDPAKADAWNNLGVSLQAAGELEQAQEAYEKALEIMPDNNLFRRNIGVNLKGLGRFQEAIDELRKVVAKDKDYAEAHWVLSYSQLILGQFEEGWKEYEWRSRLTGRAPFQTGQPWWEGQDLVGKTILVHCEQGYGDMIQFMRYTRDLKDRGARVAVRGPKDLLPLLASMDSIDIRHIDVVQPFPPHDYQVLLLSLPRILGTRLETIPAAVPYLKPSPDRVAFWKEKLEPISEFRVGIFWQGSPSYPDDRFRSIPLKQFAPLAAIPGVRLLSLQKGPGTDQIAAVNFSVLELGPELDRDRGAFMDTAGVMENLDLVITSDSAIAHLAGALGRPVWTLLGVVPDWRWLTERTDSPWYPSMKLYRQKKRLEWEDVFQRVAADLRDLVRKTRPRPLLVAIAPGELIDKITILEIKSEKLTQEDKLKNVRHELQILADVRDRRLGSSEDLNRLTRELKAVNLQLWDIEDEIRACERKGDFKKKFIELARGVYKTNDQRAALKRKINELLSSDIIEEKSYEKY